MASIPREEWLPISFTVGSHLWKSDRLPNSLARCAFNSSLSKLFLVLALPRGRMPDSPQTDFTQKLSNDSFHCHVSCAKLTVMPGFLFFIFFNHYLFILSSCQVRSEQSLVLDMQHACTNHCVFFSLNTACQVVLIKRFPAPSFLTPCSDMEPCKGKALSLILLKLKRRIEN